MWRKSRPGVGENDWRSACEGERIIMIQHILVKWKGHFIAAKQIDYLTTSKSLIQCPWHSSAYAWSGLGKGERVKRRKAKTRKAEMLSRRSMQWSRVGLTPGFKTGKRWSRTRFSSAQTTTLNSASAVAQRGVCVSRPRCLCHADCAIHHVHMAYWHYANSQRWHSKDLEPRSFMFRPAGRDRTKTSLRIKDFVCLKILLWWYIDFLYTEFFDSSSVPKSKEVARTHTRGWPGCG